MRSIFIALLIGLIAVAIYGWQNFEPEIREFAGLPPVEVVDEEQSPSAKEERKNISSTDDDESENGKESEPSLSKDEVKELKIQEFVARRYPEPARPSFDSLFPRLSDVPTSAYPEKVTVKERIKFTLIEDGELVGRSFVKAGGQVAPQLASRDGQLKILSLANDRMKHSLALSATDFETKIRGNFDSAYTAAAERIRAMREADARLLRSDSRLYRNSVEADKLWDDQSDSSILFARSALEKILINTDYQCDHYFYIGRTQDSTSRIPGRHIAIVALIEGNDKGFGPFLWRSLLLMNGQRLVAWIEGPIERDFSEPQL